VQLLDEGVGELRRSSLDGGPSHRYTLNARKAGDARIAASIPGWRYDTLVIHIASSVEAGFSEDFRAGISSQRWTALGIPAPFIKRGPDGVAALFPNGDAQWQSGLLSRDAFALRSGIDVAATFFAPFDEPPLPGALLELALVGVAGNGTIDRTAPQFADYVRVVWDGEASRLTYAVGPEAKSDPLSQLPRHKSHSIRVSIGNNGAVTFYVDGSIRWTSSLRFLGGVTEPQAHIWLGGKASGTSGSIANVEFTRR
jgi:hypothetical protein